MAAKKGAIVDDEMRSAVKSILDSAADAATAAREATAATTEMRHAFRELADDVGELKAAVFGSSPPPAPPPGDGGATTKPVPLVKLVPRTSKTEEDADALRGMVLAIDGRTANVEAQVGAFLKSKGIVAPTPEGEPDPSLWQKLVAFATSREALKFVVAMATLYAAATAAVARERATTHAPEPPAATAPLRSSAADGTVTP